MKRNQIRSLVTLALALTMVNLNAAELLGRISDETEATKAAVAVKGDSKLIYRVICSPDDEEPTPDCEKPPVEDAFNPILVDEMPQMPDEQQAQVEKVVPVGKLDQEPAESNVEKHEHHKKRHKSKQGKRAKKK